MISRRNFMKAGATSALAAGLPLASALSEQTEAAEMNQTNSFWPNGARMVISVSMQMEAGAQPSSGAESPMPKIDPKYPDLPVTKWYEYGYKEGLPRLMDMFDRRQVKVTSRMVGAAVDLHPALAKEIVQRGHEAAGHGQTWTPQYSMTPEQERESYKQRHCEHRARDRDKAGWLQCFLVEGHTAHAGDSAGARLYLSH